MARTRVEWVDAAKGGAIISVVLIHSGQWATLTELVPGYWRIINLVIVVFAMPLFFLASGLFAGSIITRTWTELWRTRLSPLVWALLVWTVVRFCYFLVVPNPTGLDETNLLNLALAPLRPSNGLWFLYALTLFFVIAKLLHGRVDWRIQLGVAAALSVVFFARADTGNIAWNGMGRYVLFFMTGLFFREQIIRFVERRGLPTGILLGVLFLAVAAAVLAGRTQVPAVTGALVLASFLAIGAGLVTARGLTGRRGMRWLPWVGRHTLPVYVLHIFFVNALISLVLLVRGERWVTVLGPALPLVVAAAATLAAVGFWWATRDLPVLRYGYVPPAWFSGTASAPLSQKTTSGSRGM